MGKVTWSLPLLCLLIKPLLQSYSHPLGGLCCNFEQLMVLLNLVLGSYLISMQLKGFFSVRALVQWGYAHSRKYSCCSCSRVHFPQHSYLRTGFLLSPLRSSVFLKRGWQYPSTRSAGCVPNQLCEHQGLPKHDLMTPGFGSRFTNFSNWGGG